MNCKKIKIISVFLLVIILLTSFNVLGNKLSTINVNEVKVTAKPTLVTSKSPTTNTPIASGSVNVRAKTNNNSEENDTPTIESSENENIQTSSQQIEEYKEALNVSGVVVGKVKVVAKLIERKRENRDNFEGITRVSTVAEETEDREILAEELLDMNQMFVNKFSDSLEVKPEVKEQVMNYVDLVKTERKVKVQIRENRIEDLFEKKITIDDFINQIWNEI